MFVNFLDIITDLETGAVSLKPRVLKDVSLYTILGTDNFGKPVMPPLLKITGGDGFSFLVSNPTFTFDVSGIMIDAFTEALYARDHKLTRHIVGVRMYAYNRKP